MEEKIQQQGRKYQKRKKKYLVPRILDREKITTVKPEGSGKRGKKGFYYNKQVEKRQ